MSNLDWRSRPPNNLLPTFCRSNSTSAPVAALISRCFFCGGGDIFEKSQIIMKFQMFFLLVLMSWMCRCVKSSIIAYCHFHTGCSPLKIQVMHATCAQEFCTSFYSLDLHWQISSGSRISRRGTPISWGWRQLPRRLRFEKFVCQNERIWTRRGGMCQCRPLDPPLQMI